MHVCMFVLLHVCLCLCDCVLILCVFFVAYACFCPLQGASLVTAASSQIDVVAALHSVSADQVQAAAKIMADQCDKGSGAVIKAYAAANAVAALVAAMVTHGAHPGAQEQLCRAISHQALLSGANAVLQIHSRF